MRDEDDLARLHTVLFQAYPDTLMQARHLSTAGQSAALPAAERAAELAGPDGIDLDALGDLQWVGFPGPSSPAWFNEPTAILRGHGRSRVRRLP
ncbi:hypothetical protein ABT187_12195 [Streptomyces sp. NPDC001817]|uniref:hypothetical protein n=1 Tax=Streptomyces sp. NPDC001817 TaxID=3154398 RepID=UPI0033196061